MKFLAKLTACGILGYAAFTVANPLSISEQEINHYLQTKLAEKVPLQDNVGFGKLFSLDYHLHDLSTQIGQTAEKRVALNGIVDSKLSLQGKQYDAKIKLNLDTVPYYDPEKGALYLKDVRLLSWQATPEKYQDELQMFMPMVADGVASLLNNNPVYTLDENKLKEAMVKKFGKAIVVEKGALRLETNIF